MPSVHEQEYHGMVRMLRIERRGGTHKGEGARVKRVRSHSSHRIALLDNSEAVARQQQRQGSTVTAMLLLQASGRMQLGGLGCQAVVAELPERNAERVRRQQEWQR